MASRFYELMRMRIPEFLATLSVEERLAGLSAEERLKGLSPEKRLEGLSPEKRLEGLSPDDLRALAEAVQRRLQDENLPPATP